MVTNSPFIGRVEKGVETSAYITEFAVIRILDAQRYNNAYKQYTTIHPNTYNRRLVRLLLLLRLLYSESKWRYHDNSNERQGEYMLSILAFGSVFMQMV